MRLGFADVDAFALVITLSDNNAQFQFVVQALAGAEVRRTVFLCWACLTDGTGTLLARYAYAGGPSVIADRSPFMVGPHGVVGRSAERVLGKKCIRKWCSGW